MIGQKYNYSQVALLCTYHYFVRQGLIRVEEPEQERIAVTSTAESSNVSQRSSIVSARSSESSGP